MVYRSSFTVLFFSLLFGVLDLSAKQADSLLIQLNQTIAEKDVYVAEKLLRIKQLFQELNRVPQRKIELQFKVLQKLSREYETFIYDSAFSTISKLQQVAYKLKDPVKIAYAKIRLGFVFLSSGLFKETLDSLVHLNVSKMPDTILTDYYFILARAYYDLGDYDKDKFFTPYYNSLGSQYIDSAMHLLKSDSYNYQYLRGLKNLKNEKMDEALSDLNTLLKEYDLTPHQVAVTASTLSHFYISQHDYDEAINLLARAAMADIRLATKETSALSTLAELLYNKGDIKNAYQYIQYAMDDAIFYGARQRKVQVGSILPIIASAKVNNVDEQRKLWLIYSTIITFLSILVLVFAVIIFKQLKKRKIAEKALQEANKIKEEYIGYYFNINSEYLGKIEAFKKSVEMKLMTKKTEDIKFIINNIDLKRERDELALSFDKVFLKLFPDFVTIFNSYFKEDDRMILKDGQLLNTELRIFALIRLGIHDTEKIAKILDYSINTIYNYKARVKGKSLIPNEDFEKKVMEIHAL